MFEWLMGFGLLPMCGLLAAIGTAVMVPAVDATDRRLYSHFVGFFAMALLLAYGVLSRPSVQRALSPQLQFEYDLQQQPMYQALSQYAQEDRDLVVGFAIKGMQEGLPMSLSWSNARPKLERIGIEALGFASVTEKVAWGVAHRDTLIELQKIDPVLCYAHISGKAERDSALRRDLSEANYQGFERAFIGVLKSRAENWENRSSGAASVSLDELQRRYATINEQLDQRHGQDVMDLLDREAIYAGNGAGAEAGICRARIDQLRMVLAEPEAIAGRMVDSLLR